MMRRWSTTTFKSLEDPGYRILWAGSTLAFLAFMMSSVVQSVVAFDLTGKNGAVGFVALGMGVATILVSPFGGVIADRVSKRRLLLIGQSTIGVNFISVGLLIVTDHITIPALVVSTFVMGAVFAFIAPARQAWIGELLPREALPNGIALQQVAMTGTRIAGPFLAGALIAISVIGTGGTYLFMGALFALVVLTLAQLPGTKNRGGTSKPSVIGDLMLGVRHVTERPRLVLLTLSFMGMIAAGYSYQVILPGFLKNDLGRDQKDIGWMLGVSAIAGLVVTIGVASLAGSKHAWKLMLGSGAVLGVSLVLLAASPSFTLALGAMLLVGGGSSGFQLLNNALVMQESDPAFYGRVMSITMLAWGMNGLAGFPFGLLADAVGERETLLIMGLLVLGVSVATALMQGALNRQERANEAHGAATAVGGE